MEKLPQITRASLEDRDRREFLEYVYACGVGNSIEEVQQWWFHFCNAAFDWLVNKERPVDLYFLKLHQSPYRQDWKDVVSRSVVHRGLSQDILQSHSEFLKRATKLDLLAMRGKYCLRNVEVQHLPIWWHTLSRAERKRLKKLGAHRYAKVFLDSVVRRLAASVLLYAEYADQVGAPCPADVQDGPGGSQVLRKAPRAAYCHWRRPPCDRFPGALLDILEKQAAEPRRVPEEDEDLSGMSDLQRAVAELRDAWGIVSQPGDRRA